MALYQGWQHAMEPFHGWRHAMIPFGQGLTAAQIAAAGGQTLTDASAAYQTGWPGVIGSAGTLMTDVTGMINSATSTPMPNAPAPAPAAPAASSSIPWLLIGGAAILYFVFMK